MKEYENEKSGNLLKKIAWWVVLAVLLIFGISFAVSLFYDYTEFKEIGEGYANVLFTNLSFKIFTQLLGFVILFILISCSIFILRRNLLLMGAESGILRKRFIFIVISFVLSLMLSSIISSDLYTKLLMFLNPKWFGKSDPIFSRDIGYYVFQRPFLSSVMGTLMTAWTLITVISLLAYMFFGMVRSGYTFRELFKEKLISVHNIINIAILLLINCATYRFKAEELLYQSFGDLSGAGYTDINIWLRYYNVVPYLIIVIAIAAIIFAFRGNFKFAALSIALFPCFWAVMGITAIITQTMVVAPNEVLRESKYIEYNIDYTKSAYGLDNTKENIFSVDNDLSALSIEENQETINNIRILDLSANLTVLNQIQGIRNYYRFYETDIIPYTINGQKTAIAITPREIVKDNLSDTANTYINKKLRYTHGFGVAANAINRVSSQGQPEFLIKDIPPKSADESLNITQPRIYFGELTNDYVIVNNSKYKELDYSEGQEDIEFSYDGKAGIKLNFLNRVMFAAKYADFRLLISDLVSSDSKILLNRNITERVKKVAPFLKYDNDPYMIIDENGRLKWIIDAYTTTSKYPYSQSMGEFNYIRNSVKVMIDAYDGDVNFYIIDETDPIIQAYKSIYPTLFTDSDLPKALMENCKYPEYLFSVKAQIFTKYHVSSPTAFYNKNDLWVIAKEKYGVSNEVRDIAPYYNMMRIEDGGENELLLTIPYTLSNKDNMVAWLAVRNDWDNYGDLVVYKFPKDINIYGPMQIENRINSDTEISKGLALWSQGGSKVIRGNMMVVPVGNSILYVEPLYMTTNNDSNLPELKQVIVAYGEKIVMRNTLLEAIYALIDKSAPQSSEDELSQFIVDLSEDEILTKIVDDFNTVQEASKQGDWKKFGEAMQELGESISEIEKRKNQNYSEENASENESGASQQNNNGYNTMNGLDNSGAENNFNISENNENLN